MKSLSRDLNSDLCATSGRIFVLRRCQISMSAVQVKDKDSVEDDQKNNKLQMFSKFENRNPRNPEYFGYNKPRGHATQKYRKDFYNK